MEPAKPISHHHMTNRWYAGDDESDSWINYLYRNLHHVEGETSPFSDSEWTYFDEDFALHDKALQALYDCPDVDASKISILVVRKDIYLLGKVGTVNESLKAFEVISNIDEAWRVINQLEVSVYLNR